MPNAAILKLPEPLATPPDGLGDLALAEWHRTAPTLRSLGRLKREFSSCLEMYCRSFAMWQQFAAETEELKKNGIYVRGVKSALTGARRACAAWALEFGFALDRSGRMNIARPLPLSTKYDRIEKRINRECDLLSVPAWLAPEPTLSAPARHEYYRVISLPRVRRRLMVTGDTDPLMDYVEAFDWFISYRDQVRVWSASRRFLAHYIARCKKLAKDLGFFFSPQGPKPKKISPPKLGRKQCHDEIVDRI